MRELNLSKDQYGRIGNSGQEALESKAQSGTKKWRLVQLMTAVEEYQGLTKQRLTTSGQNYKNEVSYKNLYLTDPLKKVNQTQIGEGRFPITAAFVAQWLSEAIVSSKTYKVTVLCDRVIKAAALQNRGFTATKKHADKLTLIGVKIVISGRILGAEIATSKTFKAGRIPNNTLGVIKDRGFALAKTRSGTIGIKVTYFWDE